LEWSAISDSNSGLASIGRTQRGDSTQKVGRAQYRIGDAFSGLDLYHRGIVALGRGARFARGLRIVWGALFSLGAQASDRFE